MRRMGKSLCGGVVDEVNSLRDVPLEALRTSLQKLLLVCVDIWQWVVRGLGSGWLESQLARSTVQSMVITYSKLDGDRKVVHPDFLLNSLSSGDTWKIDECRLDNALFALHGFDDLLCEAEEDPVSVCHRLNNKELSRPTGSLHRPLTESQNLHHPWP